LPGSSLAAALAVGCAAQGLRLRVGVSPNALAVAGSIPMVPGSFAAKAVLGLFAVTVPGATDVDHTLVVAVQHLLRVVFTLGAMGTGLAIPAMVLRSIRAAEDARRKQANAPANSGVRQS
jgi:uncharacterized membrane protein YjjB (DUF3815 family)